MIFNFNGFRSQIRKVAFGMSISFHSFNLSSHKRLVFQFFNAFCFSAYCKKCSSFLNKIVIHKKTARFMRETLWKFPLAAA